MVSGITALGGIYKYGKVPHVIGSTEFSKDDYIGKKTFIQFCL
jgi:hypothetical protein